MWPAMMLTLDGLQVLVVEDQGLIALDVCRALEAAGAVVLGPAPSVAGAMMLLQASDPDAAILDMSLLDGDATPIARLLTRRGIPFVFYSTDTPSISGVTWVEKTKASSELLDAFVQQIRRSRGS